MSLSSSQILHSYPPLFRQKTDDQFSSSHDDDDDDNEHDDDEHDDDDDDRVPVIDLKCINHEKLDEACSEWGIFRLVNHGIPLTLISQLKQDADEVFRLGFDFKKSTISSIPSATLSYFWGTPALTPSGVALHKTDSGQPQKSTAAPPFDFNWVEGFNVPLGQLSHPQLHQHHLLHSFRVLLEEYGNHQARIARIVFDAMAKNLNLCSTSEEKESYLSTSTGFLRVYRYPRCYSVKKQEVWGMEVHTDSSVVSILNQYEVGGLQFHYEKDDVWVDAKPIPNTLLVHLGDLMQAMSDDKYKSVKHRVRVHRKNDRISIGYFVFPAHDRLIRSSIYKPFTYSDFRAQVQHDIKNLGFKVGLSRFKVNDPSSIFS